MASGDELFIWYAGQGWLAHCRCLYSAHYPEEEAEAPWRDLGYQWVFRIELLKEHIPPLEINAPGGVQEETGIHTIQLGQFPQLKPVQANALRRFFE